MNQAAYGLPLGGKGPGSRHNHPNGHKIWARPEDKPHLVTQWENAITRDFAQYHQLEKHAREVDKFHEISFSMIDAKERAVHLDDQKYQDVRKKTYRVPKCL